MRQPGFLVRAIVASPDGRRTARAALMEQREEVEHLEELGELLVRTLESRGARAILREIGGGGDGEVGGAGEVAGQGVPGSPE